MTIIDKNRALDPSGDNEDRAKRLADLTKSFVKNFKKRTGLPLPLDAEALGQMFGQNLDQALAAYGENKKQVTQHLVSDFLNSLVDFEQPKGFQASTDPTQSAARYQPGKAIRKSNILSKLLKESFGLEVTADNKEHIPEEVQKVLKTFHGKDLSKKGVWKKASDAIWQALVLAAEAQNPLAAAVVQGIIKPAIDGLTTKKASNPEKVSGSVKGDAFTAEGQNDNQVGSKDFVPNPSDEAGPVKNATNLRTDVLNGNREARTLPAYRAIFDGLTAAGVDPNRPEWKEINDELQAIMAGQVLNNDQDIQTVFLRVLDRLKGAGGEATANGLKATLDQLTDKDMAVRTKKEMIGSAIVSWAQARLGGPSLDSAQKIDIATQIRGALFTSVDPAHSPMSEDSGVQLPPSLLRASTKKEFVKAFKKAFPPAKGADGEAVDEAIKEIYSLAKKNSAGLSTSAILAAGVAQFSPGDPDFVIGQWKSTVALLEEQQNELSALQEKSDQVLEAAQKLNPPPEVLESSGKRLALLKELEDSETQPELFAALKALHEHEGQVRATEAAIDGLKKEAYKTLGDALKRATSPKTENKTQKAADNKSAEETSKGPDKDPVLETLRSHFKEHGFDGTDSWDFDNIKDQLRNKLDDITIGEDVGPDDLKDFEFAEVKKVKKERFDALSSVLNSNMSHEDILFFFMILLYEFAERMQRAYLREKIRLTKELHAAQDDNDKTLFLAKKAIDEVDQLTKKLGTLDETSQEFKDTKQELERAAEREAHLSDIHRLAKMKLDEKERDYDVKNKMIESRIEKEVSDAQTFMLMIDRALGDKSQNLRTLMKM